MDLIYDEVIPEEKEPIRIDPHPWNDEGDPLDEDDYSCYN